MPVRETVPPFRARSVPPETNPEIVAFELLAASMVPLVLLREELLTTSEPPLALRRPVLLNAPTELTDVRVRVLAAAVIVPAFDKGMPEILVVTEL